MNIFNTVMIASCTGEAKSDKVKEMNHEGQNEATSNLSQDERLFCEAYAACWNGRQAYHEAVSPDCQTRSAVSAASTLLSRPEIQAEVNRIVEQRKARFELSGDLILHELMCVGFASITSFLAPDGSIDLVKLAAAPDNLKRAIEAVEVQEKTETSGAKMKIKMHSKLKALELLGKSRGIKLFVDSSEVADPNGDPLHLHVTFRKPDGQ